MESSTVWSSLSIAEGLRAPVTPTARNNPPAVFADEEVHHPTSRNQGPLIPAHKPTRGKSSLTMRKGLSLTLAPPTRQMVKTRSLPVMTAMTVMTVAPVISPPSTPQRSRSVKLKHAATIDETGEEQLVRLDLDEHFASSFNALEVGEHIISTDNPQFPQDSNHPDPELLFACLIRVEERADEGRKLMRRIQSVGTLQTPRRP